MNKKEIEEQLKLSKRQNKDERYDYLCSQFNAINYCVKLEKYTNKLQQENNQLKEEKQEWINLLDMFKNQQKEFISYLENEKDRLVRECSPIYEDSLGKTILVNEDVYNEVSKILSKIEKSDK